MSAPTKVPATSPELPGWYAPAGRYGRRRSRRPMPRWVIYALAGVVLLGGLGASWRMYETYRGDVIEAQVTAFRVVSSPQTKTHAIEITFQVNAKGRDAVLCIVRARSEDGREVGRAEVHIPTQGRQSATTTYSLATSREAVTGEVYGCAPV